jgi:hypothetical protein
MIVSNKDQAIGELNMMYQVLSSMFITNGLVDIPGAPGAVRKISDSLMQSIQLVDKTIKSLKEEER